MRTIHQYNLISRSAQRLVYVFVLMAVLATTLTGCSVLQKIGLLPAPVAAPPPIPVPVPLSEQPYTLNLRLLASSGLNPDSQSRPSPVQIRVFIMQPQADIADKEFEVMFDYAGNVMEPRPATTLTLQPGQKKSIALSANKSQSMLVVAAAYREPYQSLWNAMTTIEPNDEVSVSARIGATAVTLHPSP